MTSQVTCKEMREESFSQLRGEASALERQRFASHLERCEGCRSVVFEVSDLVETARAQRFTPAPEQRERMLEETLTRIKTLRSGNDAPARLPGIRARTAVLFALPIAAALLIGFFGTLALVEKTDLESKTESAPRAAAEVETKERSSGFAALRNVRPSAELELGVEEGTSWSFRENDARLFLEIESGTLLVQFHHLPQGRDLVVQGPGAEVQVVGTVLMVRANTTETMEVAVIEGQVEVKGAGETVTLTAGQQRTSQGNIVEMSRLDEELARIWLEDKEAPEDNARAPKARRGQRPHRAHNQGGAQVEDTELIPMNVRDLYGLAEKELSRGNRPKAARLLEELIAKAPNSAPADTARLDLARLYFGPLGRPEQARGHLNAYLKRHPTGDKSELVRQMLSKLDTR